MKQEKNHQYWMKKAIIEAQKAAYKAEVPVGCVIVRDDKIIARAHNLRELKQDPAAHAELMAIKKAAARLNSWRLLDSTLYVTLEPCIMCMGAVLLARIPKVVFGCYDPKGGAAGSLYNLAEDARLNHSVEIIAPLLETECSSLLSSFFAELRKRKKAC